MEKEPIDEIKLIRKVKNYLQVKRKRREPFICDFFAYRFLKARKWKLNDTKIMLDNYFTFRDRMVSKLHIFEKRKGCLTRVFRKGYERVVPRVLP
jgi:hypothetical protein